MKDNRRACDKCGTLVPADMLYPSTVRYGMVCASCLYEMKRIDEVRQIKATWRKAFIDMFFTDHIWVLSLLVIFLILAAIDRSGYINIFGD